MFAVWAGGIEVKNPIESKAEAEKVAKRWRAKGYDDVVIEEVEAWAFRCALPQKGNSE